MFTRFMLGLGYPWKCLDFVFLAFFVVFLSHTFVEVASIARLRHPAPTSDPLRNTLAQSPLVFDGPQFFNGRGVVLHYPGRDVSLQSRDVQARLNYFDSLFFFHTTKWTPTLAATKAAWLKLEFCVPEEKPLSVDWLVKGYGESAPSLLLAVTCP